jgi:putative membrane protein
MTPAWYITFFSALAWSAVAPKDRFTWFLEIAPALLGFALLAATRRRFPLTPLAYTLILIQSVILMVGGHYTYAEVPLFDLLRDVLHQTRNNYDNVGHFAQGFVPAIVTREVMARLHVVNGRRWLAFLTVSVCLAISAAYELFEWGTAVLTGEAAEAFLGTQGYAWDTQSDMAFALLGAVAALLLLSRVHDRQMAEMADEATGEECLMNQFDHQTF